MMTLLQTGVYYDDKAVEGFILYCENELTLTDGSDLNLLDSFKVWSEQIFGWYYFVERSVYDRLKMVMADIMLKSISEKGLLTSSTS